jgi:hypothetical protein
LLLVALLLVSAQVRAERVAMYLYYEDGTPDSTSAVVAVPAGLSPADTLDEGYGGRAKLYKPGMFYWDDAKVSSALIDIWAGPNMAALQKSSYLTNLMFGKSSVVDHILDGSKFATLVDIDSLSANYYINIPDVIAFATLTDTVAVLVDTLIVTERIFIPDTTSFIIGGLVDFTDTLRVSGWLKMDKVAEVVFQTGVLFISIPMPGLESDDICLVSLKNTTHTSSSRRFFYCDCLNGELQLRRKTWDGSSLSAVRDTVNYAVFATP